MYRNNLHVGEVGEHRVAILLEELGFSIGKPLPDNLGTDLIGANWKDEPDYNNTIFLFQVKERRSNINGVTVSSSLVWRALEQPAIVLLSCGDAFHNEFKVCILFEWILDNPLRPSLRSDKVHIAQRYFIKIDRPQDMKNLLIAEGRRVTGGRGALWAADRRSFAYINQRDLFLNFGKIALLEPPQQVITRVREILHLYSDDEVQYIVGAIRDNRMSELTEALSSDNVLNQWRSTIPRSVCTGQATQEANEFLRFIQAVRSCQKKEDQHFDMPGYTWREVSPWRIFISIFPAAFQVVERVLNNPNRWSKNSSTNKWSLGQVNAALGVASAAAHSSETLSEKAKELIRNVSKNIGTPSTCRNYKEYEFLHQYYYSLAQADKSYIDQCKAFISKHGIENQWELFLNRKYYGTNDDSITKKAIISRLHFPKRRDVDMSSLLELQFDIVINDGKFDTYA
jgi:hypothetical protein